MDELEDAMKAIEILQGTIQRLHKENMELSTRLSRALAEVDKYKEHILDLSIKLARALDEVDYWEGFWK